MHSTRRSIALTVFGCVACAGGLLHSSADDRVGIKAINADRPAYAGQTIEVRGRIHVEEYRSLEPCATADPRCGWPSATTLHVVVPGEARTDSNSLDLYEVSPGGQYRPAGCRVLSNTKFDCGPLTKDAVMTVRGLFVKERKPIQTAGPSGGPPQVLRYQDIYFLVVARVDRNREGEEKGSRETPAALPASMMLRYLTCTTRVAELLPGTRSTVALETETVLLIAPLLPLMSR